MKSTSPTTPVQIGIDVGTVPFVDERHLVAGGLEGIFTAGVRLPPSTSPSSTESSLITAVGGKFKTLTFMTDGR